jgi:hypothetical protein
MQTKTQNTETKRRGRKPVQDKQKVVNLWLRESAIEKLGGEETVKLKLVDFVCQQIEIENRKKSVLL